MMSSDKASLAMGQPRAASTAVDVLVVGGGIMGLWSAVMMAKAGLSVSLIDKGRFAGGASGGLLGALFPYLPDQWIAKKQFQFDALTALGGTIAALEQDTGRAAGYRQSGRLIPLIGPQSRRIADLLVRDAKINWRPDQGGPDWQVFTQSPHPDWLPDAVANQGFSFDSLAARVSPRDLTATLVAWLAAQSRVTLQENVGLTALDPVRGLAETGAGTIAFSHVVLAAGFETFPMLGDFVAKTAKPIGQPVKGQAALFAADVDPSLPVIFSDGLYVVAHEGGHVAVGSTSENRFEDGFSIDHQLEELIAAARTMVPALRDAPVIERWAGLRPKAIGRDPMVGPLDGAFGGTPIPTGRILAMTGGFKISFGIAHRLAQCLASYVTGHGLADLPESFLPARHIRDAGLSQS